MSIRVAESGEGVPLLLVMGIGGHLGMWEPLVEQLNIRGVRTIGYDQPGTGMSSSYPRPRRMPGIARTAERVLDELGQDRVDVLGVSFGGGVAQQLAHQAQNRVRKLVLCATSAGAVSLPGTPHALLALATPRRYWDVDYYNRIAPTVFGGRARDAAKQQAAPNPRFAHPPSLAGYGQQLFAAAGWTSFHWLPSLTQPTLVMAGDDDPIIPLTNARVLARRIPNAQLHVIRGGGHLFLLDQVEDVVPRLAEFLTLEDS